jgi:hypothetical protein
MGLPSLVRVRDDHQREYQSASQRSFCSARDRSHVDRHRRKRLRWDAISVTSLKVVIIETHIEFGLRISSFPMTRIMSTLDDILTTMARRPWSRRTVSQFDNVAFSPQFSHAKMALKWPPSSASWRANVEVGEKIIKIADYGINPGCKRLDLRCRHE